MVSCSPLKIIVLQEGTPTPPKKLSETHKPVKPVLKSIDKEEETRTDEIPDEGGCTTEDVTETKFVKPRRTSCGMCSGCQKDDCGECKPCLYMIKFGGNGKMKKKCLKRKCLYMSNSSSGSLIGKFLQPSASPSTSNINTSSTDSETLDDEVLEDTRTVQEEASIGLKRPLCYVDDSPLKPVKRRCSSRRFPDFDSENESSHDEVDSNNDVVRNAFHSPIKKSTSLSEGWSSIFKKHCKDDTSDPVTSSPVRNSSPRRYTSPRRSSPLKSLNKGSPRKSSSILFSAIKREEVTVAIDHAPYSKLVHVKQNDLTTISELKHGLILRPVPVYHIPRDIGMSLGTVTTAQSIHSTKGRYDTHSSSSQFNVDDILSEIQCQYPGIDVRGLYQRYINLKKEIDTLHTQFVKPSSGTNNTLDIGSLQCRISVLPVVNVDKIIPKIRVDSHHYIKNITSDVLVARKEARNEIINGCRKDVSTDSTSQRVRRQTKKDIIDDKMRADEKQTRGRRNQQLLTKESLCCSIHIECISDNLLIGSPKVDKSFYEGSSSYAGRKRRHSFRLAQDKLKRNTYDTRNDSRIDDEEMSTVVKRMEVKPKSKLKRGLASRASNRKSVSDDLTSEIKGSRDVIIISEDNPETITNQCSPVSCEFGHDVWSDVYQPKRSCDIIGNEESVSRIHSWLQQWKNRCLVAKETENVDLNKRHDRPLKVKTTQQDCSEEDSDFKPSRTRRSRRAPPSILDDSFNSSVCSSENDDEKAMLLCGPVGCGKTAAIYGCAQELGFKILEVNSTHLRSKQIVMSLLREATQSHHVELHNTTNTSTSSAPIVPSRPIAPTKPSKGLMAFFKPKINPKLNTINSEVIKIDEGCGNQISNATTTLILLEEVDILCDDEYKGFWSAVYDIIQITKRPIIFTANDPDMELQCPYNKVIMASPISKSLTLHCQLLSLSHDSHMTLEAANQIVSYVGGDLRKLFHMLHFWIANNRTKNKMSESPSQPRDGDSPLILRDELLDPMFLIMAGFEMNTVNILSSVLQGMKNLSTHEFSMLCNGIDMLHNTINVYDCFLSSVINSRDMGHTTSTFKSSTDDNSIHSQDQTPKNYEDLNLCVQVCDGLASADAIMSNTDSHDLSHDKLTPWWRSHVTSSLADELPESQVYHDQYIGCEYRNYIEGCLLTVQEPVCCMGTGLSSSLQWNECGLETRSDFEHHIDEVHECHMICCDVFGLRQEMDRLALTMDCLPLLHVMCSSERKREMAGTQRRFSHYFNHSQVDIKHFDSFVTKCGLNSLKQNS